jgi:steroid delta-isomerase-like uncharacterized protein
MSTEEMKNQVRRGWEALNQKNLDIINEIYAPDCVVYDPSLPEPVRGIEGVRRQNELGLIAFPDLHYTIEHLIAEGDTVAQHTTARGTHQGEFQGIPATGKHATTMIMVISRFANNKIVEEWQLYDALGLLQQLGVIPPPD